MGDNELLDHHQEHRGTQQVEFQDNHRDRDQGQNRGRNDLVDNDPNDNDMVENQLGRSRDDGVNHDRGDRGGGRH